MRNNNRFYLAGNLGADPEFKTCSNNVVKVNLRLAVNRPKNNLGEVKTDWFNVGMLFKVKDGEENRDMTFIKDMLTKGSNVTLEGHVEVNTWTSKDGEKRSSIEFLADNVLLGRYGNFTQRNSAPQKPVGSSKTTEVSGATLKTQDLARTFESHLEEILGEDDLDGD